MKTQEEILSLLADGLRAAGERHTETNLGDRSQYLGLSDLALGLACPRAVAADKLAGDGRHNLETLLKLHRGRWLEHGVEEALGALKRQYISQLRLSLDHEGGPVKGHLDLLLPDEEGVTVLELKSAARLRNEVYPNHEAQLYGQLGLLRALWNRPAFSAGDHSVSYSLPELVRRRLELRLPDSASSASIRGFVLTVDAGGARAFGPYEPSEALLTTLLQNGTLILAASRGHPGWPGDFGGRAP